MKSFLILHFTLLCICLGSAFGQTPEEFLNQNKAIWPGKDVIFTEIRETVTIDKQDDSLVAYMSHFEERLILSSFGSSMAEESVSHSEFFPLTSISAKTLIPEKKKYQIVEVEEFKQNDRLEGSVFHDDVVETVFYFPDLQEGAKSQLAYEQGFTDVRFLNSFFLISYLPVNKLSYEIRFPEGVDLYVSEFNLEGSDTRFTKEEENGYTVWRWERDSIPLYPLEGGSPDIRYHAPHLIPRVRFFDQEGRKEQVLEDVSDLFQWYSEWVDSLNTSDENPEIQMVLDSILTDGMSEIEKVERIYTWVQNNVKYIALEAGYEGFIPREAELVCQRRYGDCKDMSSLITQMLRMAGVENTYLAWIGTRDIPYTYNELPTPITDNHMIAVYLPDDSEPIFLDGTGEHLPFGYPSSFIQGKEAMVCLKPFEEFKIIQVPIMKAHESRLVDSVVISVSGDTLIGTGLRLKSGYFRSFWESKLADRSGQALKDFLRNELEQGSNKFLLQDFQIEKNVSRKEALAVSYDFSIPDYATSVDGEIYLNPFLQQYFKNYTWEEDRKLPVSYKHASSREFYLEFDLRDKYEILTLPESFFYEDENLSLQVECSENGNSLFCKTSVQLKQLLVETEDFNSWNEAVEELSKTYRSVISLKAKK